MGFLSDYKIAELKGKLVDDPSTLGKLYKAKKSEYFLKNVDHSLVNDMVANEGWEEYGSPLKTKTKLRKVKDHDQKFEDDIWCQLYELGFRHLNYDREFCLPFGKDPSQTKQIDVVAINQTAGVVLLVECKSSKKRSEPPSLKTEFEGLPQRLSGFKQSIAELFGKGVKVKYVFATRNLRIDSEGADIQRLIATKSFFYNDNTYRYVNNLIAKYKGAASYQFLGTLFKGEDISSERIELPAIEGKMGKGKTTYYMFSIEPHLLLKMGFILHRTEANESELPNYQRLLIPSRLKGITAFIDGGGYFPNSVIVNFNAKDKNLQFEGSVRGADTQSRFGTLKIQNAYAIAYIIDGQHRLYGYANSGYKETNTIPVVAFVNLDPAEQLKIFVDINENQKAVSATLRLTLEEDLFWNSDRTDSRLKALRASIIRVLTNTLNGPLYGKIQIGEDSALLSSKPFADALSKSGLLPRAKGNTYISESVPGSLYDTNNHNHSNEMVRARKNIAAFLNLCYRFAEDNYKDIFEREKYLLISNRGTFAFISLIGSLNAHETSKGILTVKSTPTERFEAVEKYLRVLFDKIRDTPDDEVERLLSMLGSTAETKWLRDFQSRVNDGFPEYYPAELVDWMERQDDELQSQGRQLGVEIERNIKQRTLGKLKVLFGDNWDLEIGNIKTSCEARANEEIQRHYSEGLGRKDIHWTEMFNIYDYKTIIDKHWTKRPKPDDPEFITFEEEFSIDVGLGFNSKAEKLKWMSIFNSHRNLWAHEGTKEKRLNRDEVDFLKRIHDRLVGD
ncbi:MAG: DGQHR domain-containing protein [Chloracidobacterium sp.]|nr:DGQHR domain-containing protein [Chloracidobacterium sp.]MBK9438232.1 DGQHR domain-containing protein [Chloracidobacterium sp.]MBL0240887.1 DGQHR domain-containing protein [Chloracidobacterium sp.]